jgi:hypothetical protein
MSARETSLLETWGPTLPEISPQRLFVLRGHLGSIAFRRYDAQFGEPGEH